MRKQQNRGAAEQGNSCEQETRENVACAMVVRAESELVPMFDLQRSKERPEQHDCSDKQRAMKEFFEIVAGEKWKNVVRSQPLRRPKQNRCEQRADEQRHGEVGEQSRCVFQDCYVRLRRDAQSTHMDGKG